MAVTQGRVTLSGTVASEWERTERRADRSQAARRDGRDELAGGAAGGVDRPAFLGLAAAYGRDGESGDIPGRIEALFERDIEIGGAGIRITGQRGRVVLTGHVRSWRERDLAERVAWSAPGVTQIEDYLVVRRTESA